MLQITVSFSCHNKGEYLDYVCIHPPSTKYNQYDGEYGYYLGPEGFQPKDMKYGNSKDDMNRLEEYFFCYPTYEDENYIEIRSCKEHYNKPTMLRFDLQFLIEAEKRKRLEILPSRNWKPLK